MTPQGPITHGKKPLVKSCKLCHKNRYANTSWCYQHYREREKQKRIEKANRKLERKVKTKSYQASQRKKWHTRCWTLMSEWVRRKDADFYGFVECYTCFKSLHWKEANAGHYQHGKLDFDSRNLKPQCPACNLYHSGKLDNYTVRLVEENGFDWVKQLKIDADRHMGYSLEELRAIFADLHKKVELLRRQGG